jgi:hypothetical protein
MEINNFKIFLAKLYYSIKGFFMTSFNKEKTFTLKKLGKELKYVHYKHIQKNEFLISAGREIYPKEGVFYKTERDLIPYNIIGKYFKLIKNK